jgi:hypothetical protein
MTKLNILIAGIIAFGIFYFFTFGINLLTIVS